MPRFAYYARLSRADQATYRKSDGLRHVALDDVRAHRAHVAPLAQALAALDGPLVRRHAQALVDGICRDARASRVTVRILKVRPSDDSGELHGLYELTEGERPVIRVWMKTAAHQRPVALRTFVRTLLHEVVHHLDFTVLKLPESFHTEGFFARENDLTRQILGVSPRPTTRVVDDAIADAATVDVAERPPSPPPAPPRAPRRRRVDDNAQLTLFGAPSSDE